MKNQKLLLMQIMPPFLIHSRPEGDDNRRLETKRRKHLIFKRTAGRKVAMRW